jgi:hypothetical protein
MKPVQKLSLWGKSNAHETALKYPLSLYNRTEIMPIAGWVLPTHPSADITENGIVVLSSSFGQRYAMDGDRIVMNNLMPTTVFDCKIGVDFYYDASKVFSTPENPRQRVYLKLIKIANDATPAKEFFSFETYTDQPSHQKLYSEADYEEDPENLVFIGECNSVYNGLVTVIVSCGQRNLSVV